MCDKCKKKNVHPDHVWKLKIVNFPWTIEYAEKNTWAWTPGQAEFYCNGHTCKIIAGYTRGNDGVPVIDQTDRTCHLQNQKLRSEIQGNLGIEHEWVAVEMRDGPKKGINVVVARAWLSKHLATHEKHLVTQDSRLRKLGEMPKYPVTTSFHCDSRGRLLLASSSKKKIHVEPKQTYASASPRTSPTYFPPMRVNYGDLMKSYNADHPKKKTPSKYKFILSLAVILLGAFSTAIWMLIA